MHTISYVIVLWRLYYWKFCIVLDCTDIQLDDEQLTGFAGEPNAADGKHPLEDPIHFADCPASGIGEVNRTVFTPFSLEAFMSSMVKG